MSFILLTDEKKVLSVESPFRGKSFPWKGRCVVSLGTKSYTVVGHGHFGL